MPHFLRLLRACFANLVKSRSTRNRELQEATKEIRRRAEARDTAGFINGRHFSAYASEAIALRRAGRVDEAEKLLLTLVEATEADARANNWSVAPSYYKQLAILYKKRKDTASELAILERYESQNHGRSGAHSDLIERLQKARDRIQGEKLPGY